MRQRIRAPRGLTLLQTATLAGMSGIMMLGGQFMFTEAELNALVAESRARQAVVAEALEAYHADWAIYPYDGYNYNFGGTHDYNFWHLPADLTTPVGYLVADQMLDPFRVELADPKYAAHWQWFQMRYTGTESTWGDAWDALVTGSQGDSVYLGDVEMEFGEWRLLIVGPDGLFGPNGWEGVSEYPALPQPYDPSNGIMSQGDLIWCQVAPQGYLNLPPLE